VDLVKTKDGPGSDKKIFGLGPDPDSRKIKNADPGPGRDPRKRIIQTRVRARARIWACPQLPILHPSHHAEWHTTTGFGYNKKESTGTYFSIV
jgi:hypothetical protein